MKFVEWQWTLYFYCPHNTKIANVPRNRSAALSFIHNWFTTLQLHWHPVQLEIWLEPDLAGFPKKWSDSGFAEWKSGTTIDDMLFGKYSVVSCIYEIEQIWICVCIQYTVRVKKSPHPRADLWQFFQNCWEFFNQILHAYCAFLCTLEYEFLLNYLQLDKVMPY